MDQILKASPDEVRKRFFLLETREDLADLLEVPYWILAYHLYRIAPTLQYKTFTIKKKSGGHREISAPTSSIKILQKKLVTVLYSVYRRKPCVNGFVSDRSILDNALAHRRRRWVLNVDLENFFPSIHFGRVQGLFMGRPYGRNREIATALAKLCCFEKRLPQGAPTSPIISNMICARMDGELIRLASELRCTYTRYADDLTFSTTRNDFPETLAKVEIAGESRKLFLGEGLAAIISSNGFVANLAKQRLQGIIGRQEVTGLVVNKFPNIKRRFIRQVRAMLHAWSKFGLENAEKEFRARYMRARNPERGLSSFKQVIKGKIEFIRMVRGKDDFLYKNIATKVRALDPSIVASPSEPVGLAHIRTCLWVLEDEAELLQGTAFMLEGYGLVTCFHVLGPNTKAFQPSSPERYPVEVIKKDASIDIAILKISAPAERIHCLAKGNNELLKDGDAITVHGFPNYSEEDQGFIYSGHISGRRTIFPRGRAFPGVRRIMINAPIVAGNSGGPVLDKNDRVIGVAATGADDLVGTTRAEKNGVIPIELLDRIES